MSLAISFDLWAYPTGTDTSAPILPSSRQQPSHSCNEPSSGCQISWAQQYSTFTRIGQPLMCFLLSLFTVNSKVCIVKIIILGLMRKQKQGESFLVNSTLSPCSCQERQNQTRHAQRACGRTQSTVGPVLPIGWYSAGDRALPLNQVHGPFPVWLSWCIWALYLKSFGQTVLAIEYSAPLMNRDTMPGCLPYPATCQLCSTTSLHFPRFHISRHVLAKRSGRKFLPLFLWPSLDPWMGSFAALLLAIVKTLDLVITGTV